MVAQQSQVAADRNVRAPPPSLTHYTPGGVSEGLNLDALGFSMFQAREENRRREGRTLNQAKPRRPGASWRN